MVMDDDGGWGQGGILSLGCCGVSVLQLSVLIAPHKERSFHFIWELEGNIGDMGGCECFDHGWRCQKYRLLLQRGGVPQENPPLLTTQLLMFL